MVSKEILMVLFYNCTTTIVNLMAQTHLDGQEVGIVGIFSKAYTENRGVLNLAAFNCLTSSIFQLMLLYCIYSRYVLEKQINLNSELLEAIDLIITNI